MIAKYRKDEFPNEWWLTDSTMEQVEYQLNKDRARIAELETERDALKAENERLRKALVKLSEKLAEEQASLDNLMRSVLRLIAAAENVIKKTECRAVLSEADLSWLKREVRRALDEHLKNQLRVGFHNRRRPMLNSASGGL